MTAMSTTAHRCDRPAASLACQTRASGPIVRRKHGWSSDYSINEPASLSPGFHPDRLGGAHTVAELLARDGVYRSQFETGSPTVG
jgi:hypothetical protein